MYQKPIDHEGQNLRLHPDLGTVVAIDGDLKPDHPFVNAAPNFLTAPTNTLADLLPKP
ncbi:hypothetical protein [Cyclobacterium lianum]|uniref:hypothetical protein n=1 Tax=Cyclobacterium lianum TaxID=388280 RepID=UPI000AC0446B|nr:hypothetical protein [Cyclobacterium lianum]